MSAPSHLASLAEHPVFVLGYYKSGTTLVLNLLDGHPDVLSLPGESRYFAHLDDVSARHDREASLRRLHAVWVRNTITPYGLPPRWVLGQPQPDAADPYDELGRHLVAFARGRAGRDPLAAAAQALAAVTGSSPRLWVEKTPMHEFHLERILAAYPEARFVHIVRDPCATIESIQQYESGEPIVDPLTGAAELSRSFAIALDAQRQLGDRYTIIRYESLVTDTPGTMRIVAAGVGIAFDERLLVPTTLGRPSTANAGRPERRVAGNVHSLSLDGGRSLRRRDRMVVTALAGRPAESLGYCTHGGSRAVALAARAALFSRYRLAPRLLGSRSG